MTDPAVHDTGTVVAGRYRLENLVGRGGMGEVWSAHQLDLPRRVALKILHSPDSPDALEREALFLRGDARAAARIRHPNVVKVYEAGEDPQVGLFVAMEYVAGWPLDRVAMMLRPHEAVAVLMQVLGALEAAHREGVLHRDIKPGNVLVQQVPGHGYFVTVVDFGIARVIEEGDDLTEVGICRGTPTWLAPEQAMGIDADARADVYAAAAVLYHLLSGSLPYPRGQGENHLAYLYRKTQTDPLLPEKLSNGRAFPQELGEILLRSLARDPELRHPSAEALRLALEPWSRAEAWNGGAPPSAAPARPRPPRASVPSRPPPGASPGGGDPPPWASGRPGDPPGTPPPWGGAEGAGAASAETPVELPATAPDPFGAGTPPAPPPPATAPAPPVGRAPVLDAPPDPFAPAGPAVPALPAPPARPPPLRPPRPRPARPEAREERDGDWLFRGLLWGLGAVSAAGWASLATSVHAGLASARDAASAAFAGSAPAAPAWAAAAYDAAPPGLRDAYFAWAAVAWGGVALGLAVGSWAAARRGRWEVPVVAGGIGFVRFLLWAFSEAQVRGLG